MNRHRKARIRDRLWPQPYRLWFPDWTTWVFIAILTVPVVIALLLQLTG